MDAKSRKNKIKEIIKGPSPDIGKLRLVVEHQPKAYECYAIPVKYLVFNQYNGRIGSYVATYERNKGPIDPSKPEGEKIIMESLWEAHEDQNKRTLDNIKRNGQLVPGVITLDGVIVDGNRRCLMLKKIAQDKNVRPVPFICAVLPFTIDAKPQEIRRLEGWLQHFDDKVSYGSIEKYLMCREYIKDGRTHEEIAHIMNEKKGAKIKEYLEILKLMDLYLQWIGAEGVYKYLTVERLEGPFVDMHKYLSVKNIVRDWNPTRRDEAELKRIVFDFIRADYRQQIRKIIKNKDGAFSKQTVWGKIRRSYKETIVPINNEEKPLPKNEASDVKRIKERDEAWREKAGNRKRGPIRDIMKEAEEDLNRIDLAEKPMKLLNRIKDDMETLLSDPEVSISTSEKKILLAIKILVDKLAGLKK